MPMDSKVSLMPVESSAMDPESQVTASIEEQQTEQAKTPKWRDHHPAFQWPKGGQPAKGSFSETSDQEEARLKQQGVDGIGNSLYLGKNVDDRPVILLPMNPDEALIRIPLPNSKSTGTMIENTTKLIAQNLKTGSRDISHIEFWHDGAKDRPHLAVEPGRTETFCDNMTLWAFEMFLVIRFFECFDLSSQKNGEASSRFKVNGCGNESLLRETICRKSDNDKTLIKCKKTNRKFKVMLCGVPMSTNIAIHKVLSFVRTLSLDTLNSEEKLTEASLQFKEQNWREFHPKKLLNALVYASQLKYIDTDLATDYGGTLHINNLEAVIKSEKHRCVAHKCGRNMVRMAPITTESKENVNLKTQGKFYNKVAETATSSSARSREIGQKLHYLLNPSTPSLKDTFRNFHNEGITRFETTHSSVNDSGEVPDILEMLSVHESLASPLTIFWNETLVQCSIHDHIKQLEIAAECSVATMFPHMTSLKRSSLKKGTMSTAKANKEPEGCIVHYYNSETTKFIGNMIHSQLQRYGNTRIEGFQQLAQNLAWGSLCGKSPILAICVAGPGMCLCDGEICTDEGFDVKRCLYFRLVHADVISGLINSSSEGAGSNLATEKRRMLMAGKTGLFSGKGSLGFTDTDMQLIGVNLDCLDNLRISLMDKKFEPSYENMGHLLISLRPLTAAGMEDGLNQNMCPFELAGAESGSLAGISAQLDVESKEEGLIEGESTCISEVHRLVAGVEGRLVPIGSLPRAKVRAKKYYDQTSPGRVMLGEKKKGKTLVILAGGDKYKVPDHASNGLLEAIKENEALGIKRQLYVWQDADGKFRWEFDTDTAEPVYMDNSQTCKAALIPERTWMEIAEIGEMQHAKGGKQMFARIKESDGNKKYFLPLTIKEQLIEHTRQRNVGLRDLKGLCLMRTGAGLVKTVPKSKHNEPPILIVFTDGTEIRNHISSIADYVTYPTSGFKRASTESSEQGQGPQKRSRQ